MRDSYVIDSKLFGLECFIKYQFHQMRKEYENDMGGNKMKKFLTFLAITSREIRCDFLNNSSNRT